MSIFIIIATLLGGIAAGITIVVHMEKAGKRIRLLKPSLRNWKYIELTERYFAWDGPTIHLLKDLQAIDTPLQLQSALRKAGMIPSYGLKSRLRVRRTDDRKQLFEIDRNLTWKRELRYLSYSDQVLLVRPEKKQVKEEE